MFNDWERWIHCLNNRPSDDDWFEWFIDFTSYVPVFTGIFSLIFGTGIVVIILQAYYFERMWNREL